MLYTYGICRVFLAVGSRLQGAQGQSHHTQKESQHMFGNNGPVSQISSEFTFYRCGTTMASLRQPNTSSTINIKSSQNAWGSFKTSLPWQEQLKMLTQGEKKKKTAKPPAPDQYLVNHPYIADFSE
jgi:hypothetical protein